MLYPPDSSALLRETGADFTVLRVPGTPRDRCMSPACPLGVRCVCRKACLLVLNETE